MTHAIPDALLAPLHTLIEAGTPISVFAARSKYATDGGAEFHFRSWKNARPSKSRLRSWQPGHAVVALTGAAFDVVDVDARNGGLETFTLLEHLLPEPIAVVETPSPAGTHIYIPATGFPTVQFGGVDYLGKAHLVYLPATQRPKYNGAGYTWTREPQFDLLRTPDSRFVEALIELAESRRPRKLSEVHEVPQRTLNPDGSVTDVYYLLSWGHSTVARAAAGQRNNCLNRVSFMLGQRLRDDIGVYRLVTDQLLGACHKNGLLHEDGHQACLNTIHSAFNAGHLAKGAC